MSKTLLTATQPRERRLLGAEHRVVFTPSELVRQVSELGQIAKTIRGGKLEQIMNSDSPSLDLGQVLRHFNTHRVEFLVVGGYAVAFHGHPRFTRDLDLYYRLTPENAARILAAFSDCGLKDLRLTQADLVNPDINYKIGFPPDQLDLNPSVKGLEWTKAWAASLEGSILGQPVKFLDFDSLITAKAAAGRPQDLADIEHLMQGLSGV